MRIHKETTTTCGMNCVTVCNYSARARRHSKNASLSILSKSSGVVDESQAGLYITAHKQQQENYSRAEDFSQVLCSNNAFQQQCIFTSYARWKSHRQFSFKQPKNTVKQNRSPAWNFQVLPVSILCSLSLQTLISGLNSRCTCDKWNVLSFWNETKHHLIHDAVCTTALCLTAYMYSVWYHLNTLEEAPPANVGKL